MKSIFIYMKTMGMNINDGFMFCNAEFMSRNNYELLNLYNSHYLISICSTNLGL